MVQWLWVFVWMNVHVCARACMYMCVCACQRPEANFWWHSSIAIYLALWDRISLAGWDLATLGWAALSPRWPTCLCLHSTGIEIHATMPDLLCVFQGSNSGPHACRTNALLTQPSPLLLIVTISSFVLSVLVCRCGYVHMTVLFFPQVPLFLLAQCLTLQ